MAALLSAAAGCRTAPRTGGVDHSIVHGYVAPGFEEVRGAFAENFARRGEVGAACAAYYRGELVVDLWGGVRDQSTGDAWTADTMVMVFSATKGICGLALALAHSRGWLDYDAPVARYWPEFAAHGKGTISVRQLLAHQAGLCAIDERLDWGKIADGSAVARIAAAQRPLWPPGSRHGYHALSLGWYEAELIRRVDPQHRSIGRFVREELAGPLEVEFHVGLPDSVDRSRVANVIPFDIWDVFRHLDIVPPEFAWSMLWPHTIPRRALTNPRVNSLADFDTPEYRAVEFPAANGIGTARAIAAMYGAFANGGHAYPAPGGIARQPGEPMLDAGEASAPARPPGDPSPRALGPHAVSLGIRRDTLAELAAAAKVPPKGAKDVVLKVDTLYSLGFMKSTSTFRFSDDSSAYGAAGAGGSLGFADPSRRLGFAYVLNRTRVGIGIDPRAAAARDAVFRCIERLDRTER